jgi:Holliday junction resolvase RusA-like endonuclease
MEASALTLFPDEDRPDLEASPDAVRVTVFGTPQPAGSKTAGQTKGGRLFVRDAAKKSRPWKDAVTQEAGPAMEGRELLRGPIGLRLVFIRARPKAHYGKRGLLPSAPKYPTTKPDLTKYVRGVEDALRGVVWKDDSQVVSQANDKRYGSPERVEILVTELEP